MNCMMSRIDNGNSWYRRYYVLASKHVRSHGIFHQLKPISLEEATKTKQIDYSMYRDFVESKFTLFCLANRLLCIISNK